ncbi:MAG: hypothetical protein V1824_00020 [archaeon]
MMEFTLSKLNMLIFVTAIAAIVVFFSATVNSNLKTRQGFELAYKITQNIKSGLEANSYCSIKEIEIPNYLKTSASASNLYKINYILNFSEFTIPQNNNSQFEKKLVTAIFNTKRDKILAAYDVDYNGVFHFYSAEMDDQGGYNYTDSNNSVDYNPLKENSLDNKLFFIKKINNGINHYYIFPCAKKNGILQCKDYGYYGTSANRFICSQLFLEEKLTCIDSHIELTCNVENQ